MSVCPIPRNLGPLHSRGRQTGRCGWELFKGAARSQSIHTEISGSRGFTNQENGFDSSALHSTPKWLWGPPRAGKAPRHDGGEVKNPQTETAGARQMQIHKDKNIRKHKTIKTSHQNYFFLVLVGFLVGTQNPRLQAPSSWRGD